MKRYTVKQLIDLIFGLEWTGHAELPTMDVEWLASELYGHIFSDSHGRCENCGSLHEVIVETNLGDICESCIAEASANAAAMREDQEDA